MGALIVDVKGMIHVNARHGFPAATRCCAPWWPRSRRSFPGAKLVRLHGDNFAALLVPTSGLSVAEELREPTRARLVADARAALPEGAEAPDFTLALLDLTHRAAHRTGRCWGRWCGRSWSAPTPWSGWGAPGAFSAGDSSSGASSPAPPSPENAKGARALGPHPFTRISLGGALPGTAYSSRMNLRGFCGMPLTRTS